VSAPGPDNYDEAIEPVECGRGRRWEREGGRKRMLDVVREMGVRVGDGRWQAVLRLGLEAQECAM
jgi:hypothetical protein